MKKIFILFFNTLLLVIAVLNYGCKDKRNTTAVMPPQKPTTVVNTVFRFTYKDSKIIEFKESHQNNAPKDIAKEDMNSYFGSNVTATYPNEIQINKDSLLMYRGDHLIKKFAVKWENNKVSVYQPYLSKFIKLGDIQANSSLTISMIYYNAISDTEHRHLSVSGKEYFISNPIDITTVESEQNQFVWLNMQYHFEKNTQ